jgi:hypothetical protein
MIYNGIRFIFAIGLVSLCVPFLAHAGAEVITAHELTITIKSLSQTTDSHDNDKPDKTSVDRKDLFELCVGRRPQSDEGVFLFINCTNLNQNQIMAIDKNPLTGLQEIGSMDFDLDHAVVTTKNGVLKSATIPVEVTLECGDTAVDAFGAIDIKYSDLGALDACVESAKVKVTGTGVTPGPGNFIVDDGSSITVKKRDGGITTVPPL